jgi:hypothetical protein
LQALITFAGCEILALRSNLVSVRDFAAADRPNCIAGLDQGTRLPYQGTTLLSLDSARVYSLREPAALSS